MPQKKWTFDKPIKLTLSGGGYRAAAFHLGTLNYLYHAGLLEEVDTLSTVSGGTITGAAYAISLKSREPFRDFFNRLGGLLLDHNLVSDSLGRLGLPSGHTLSGYHNLITSLAETYDVHLTRGRKFGMFWGGADIHLKEIIFNATEFRTGLGFRFQKSGSRLAWIGNRGLHMKAEAARKIRMADIVAASSCFPGGFEPIAFPHDFKWPDREMPASLKKDFPEPVPLMDGGVYDNQGIESALLAEERAGSKVGLFIISDVDTPDYNIYGFPEKKKGLPLTVRSLYVSALAGSLMLLLSSLGLMVKLFVPGFVAGLGPVVNALCCIIPSLSCLTAVLLFFVIRNRITRRLRSAPPVVAKFLRESGRLTLDQFIDIAELRITSLVMLTSKIFMRRIRQLVYRMAYKSEKEKRDNTLRISNLIYDINRKAKKDLPHWLHPTRELRRIAGSASAMKTTLWFDKREELDNLVACGQFTICFNILEHIILRYGADRRKYNASIRGLFDRARADWLELKGKPLTILS